MGTAAVSFSEDESFSAEERFMERAIELAQRGTGKTNPNPLVGAVIVQDGKIIGEGWHETYGGLHAERNALKNCRENGNTPEGADMYVTLEPCCHHGKQPPCTAALSEAKLRRVIVGSQDPNPLVHGKGIALLCENGITVIEHFLEAQCDALNPFFFHFITTGLPFTAVKYAMTLDGKIATKTGASKWITGSEARTHVHSLRNTYAGILCGIGTVRADDPLLTCRISGGRNPTRIICDSFLSISAESRIVRTAAETRTLIACLPEAASERSEKARALEKAGAEILPVAGSGSPTAERRRLDMAALMKELGKRQLDSVLIEGGAAINASAFSGGIVQKVYCYVAPSIFGGAARSPVAGDGISFPDEATRFLLERTLRLGEDILLEYRANPAVEEKTRQ